MTARVISAVNRKGGVGKTSTTFHLAGYYAGQSQKKNVLVIDADPQHSLSTGIFGPQIADSLDVGTTIAGLFDESMDPLPEDVIRPTPFPRIDIVAGSDELTNYNLPKPDEGGILQLALKDFISEIRDRYDIVLIDLPPNIQMCTWAALTASDYALCISQPEDYGSQGCVAVQKAIDHVLQTTNPNLKLAGYLLNLVNKRLSIHKAYEALLRELYEEKVFKTRMPLSTHFKEAIAARKPITEYKPKSVAAEATRSLGKELLKRMKTLDARPAEFEYAGNKFAAGLGQPKAPEAA
ncbi:MAG: ParA family protein [Planctomycetota bacterium]